MPSGQNIATSHDLTPKGSVLEGKSPYFRIIQVGEILFHLARCILFKCCNVRFLSGPMVPFNKKKPSDGSRWKRRFFLQHVFCFMLNFSHKPIDSSSTRWGPRDQLLIGVISYNPYK